MQDFDKNKADHYKSNHQKANDYKTCNKVDKTDAYVYDLLVKAEKYREKEMYESELGILLQVLEYDPNHPYVWVKIGRVYRILGNYEKAFDAYNQALLINPSDPFIYNNLGTLYIMIGKNDNALYNFEKALDMMPEITDGYETLLANYALALAVKNEKKKAWKYLSKAVKLGYSKADVIRRKGGLNFWNRFFG